MKKQLAYFFAVILPILIYTSCKSAKNPKTAYKNAERFKPFDAIIVPGVPFKNGSWDSVMKARVLWSWVLYKNGIAKNVIYSGGAVYSPFKEAIVMGLYAQKLGIPAENMFYDTLARHSTENVYYSYILAKKLGFKSLALATDPFQSFMLRGFTRKRFATPIYHVPFVTDSLSLYNYQNPKIDPHSAYIGNFTSITQNESFLKRLKGTMGGNIDWSQYEGGRLAPL